MQMVLVLNKLLVYLIRSHSLRAESTGKSALSSLYHKFRYIPARKESDKLGLKRTREI